MPKIKKIHATREDWMTAASEMILDDLIMPLVTEYDRPKYRVSVGFPAGHRNKKVLAMCWARTASTGGVNEIFVTPERAEIINILETLAHELIHAVDDCESGHRGFFARIARGIGLEGKLTATYAGEQLRETLEGYVALLGEYPHEAMDVSARKKDGTRQLKVTCSNCELIFRTSQKWLDHIDCESHCPVCGEMGTLEAA